MEFSRSCRTMNRLAYDGSSTSWCSTRACYKSALTISCSEHPPRRGMMSEARTHSYGDYPLGNVVQAVNDPFGASVACFRRRCSPGEIVKRTVHKKNVTEQVPTQSNFRILKRAYRNRVQRMAYEAGDTRPLQEGYWYEVIGD